MTPAARPAVSFFRAHVAHVRLRPHAHRFSYIVPLISVDVDRMAGTGRRPQLVSIGKSIKSPHRHINRMNRPTGQDLEQLVPVFLELQSSLHLSWKLFRQLNSTQRSEKIGSLQQVHMQGVTFNPLPAIE